MGRGFLFVIALALAFSSPFSFGGSAAATHSAGSHNPSLPPIMVVDMHYGALKGVGFLSGVETGGVFFTKVSSGLAHGSRILLDNPKGYTKGQLIVYQSVDSNYYTGVVGEVDGVGVILKNDIESPIAKGGFFSNFYYNEAHPNVYGFRALADFSQRSLDSVSLLDHGTHVLLGDSWFAYNAFPERIAEKLPHAKIINKGVGGNTSSQIMARFDKDVVPENPDFVWIMVGTNDIFQKVPSEKFGENIRTLKERVSSIRARIILFNPSVGPLGELFSLSEDMANLAEYDAPTRPISLGISSD